MSTEPVSLFSELRDLLGEDLVERVDAPQVRCRPTTVQEVARIAKAAWSRGVRLSIDESIAEGAPAQVYLDMRHMNQLLRVDEVSLLCEAQAGITLLDLECALRNHGLSLGPLPAPSLRRTLGAALSAPRPAESSPRLGRLRDRPVRVGAVLPDGTELSVPLTIAPRRASGPDLKQILIGARGATGVITSVLMPVTRIAERTQCMAWLLSDPRSGLHVLTEVLEIHGGAGPANLMLASGDLLMASGAMDQDSSGGVGLLCRLEGSPRVVAAEISRIEQVVGEGRALPQGVAAFWLGEDLAAERLAERAHRWPQYQQALSWPSTGDLEGLWQAGDKRTMICGVHLLGVCLCRDVPPSHVPGADGPAGPLTRLMEVLLSPG